MKQWKRLPFLYMTMVFAGCSPVKPHLINSYLLNTIPCDLPTKKKHAITVMVTAPISRPIYNTRQMAYMGRPFQIAYFSDNAWAETPTDMLRPLLIQSLQDTHYFRQIVTTPYAGPYDYLLSTDLLALYQDFSHGNHPCLVMSLRAQIYKMPDMQIVATRQFTMMQSFLPATPYGGVFAANHVSARLLKKVALFSMQAMHSSSRNR